MTTGRKGVREMPPEYWILVEREDELISKLHQWDIAILNVHDQPERLAQAKAQRDRISWAADVVADCIRMYLADHGKPCMAAVATLVQFHA